MNNKEQKLPLIAILSIPIIIVAFFLMNAYDKSHRDDTQNVYDEYFVNQEVPCDTIMFGSTRLDTLECMQDAFAYVESRYHCDAVSANGLYVGLLQISKICVDECNRILKEDVYTYDDRYDCEKSREMFNVIQNHHNKNLDIDRAVDLWNGRCKDSYRNSVKEIYYEHLENQSQMYL